MENPVPRRKKEVSVGRWVSLGRRFASCLAPSLQLLIHIASHSKHDSELHCAGLLTVVFVGGDGVIGGSPRRLSFFALK
jgi:hypothetical protein